jgi:anti-sigma factor (TIGR02949 family)
MNCADAEIMLHALIDGELDAGHARDVEAHVATCPACAEALKTFRAMRATMAEANLKEAAPAQLRNRIEAALAVPAAKTSAQRQSWFASVRTSWRESWKNFFGGFAVGTALSAAVAASLVIAVIRNDQNQQIAGDIVSAHLRSLQAGHLTDVETSDQHTVKPWFNGKLDVAPPVIDLTAQGFTLIGGRLDYINGQPVASIVYRRRKHVINLFVAQQLGAAVHGVKDEIVQGFNIRHWSEAGLDLWAVSDIDAGELDEFGQKFTAALHAP